MCLERGKEPNVARLFLWFARDEFSASFSMVYDDVESIEYFGKGLKPLWTQTFNNAEDLIEHIGVYQKDILQRAQEFDVNVAAELEYEMGSDMAQVCQLAFRQVRIYCASLGSHFHQAVGRVAHISKLQVSGAIKLTRGSDDDSAWAFMKEISSDGGTRTLKQQFLWPCML